MSNYLIRINISFFHISEPRNSCFNTSRNTNFGTGWSTFVPIDKVLWSKIQKVEIPSMSKVYIDNDNIVLLCCNRSRIVRKWRLSQWNFTSTWIGQTDCWNDCEFYKQGKYVNWYLYICRIWNYIQSSVCHLFYVVWWPGCRLDLISM